MHRALLLPEIVANILQSEAASPGFLHNSLLINRLFSLEATRMLWKGCGVRYNPATAGHVTPNITDLARLAQADSGRAQFYADFVQILFFDEEGEDSGFAEEARWHSELAALQFPNLHEVGFYGFEKAAEMNSGDVVLRYAQPGVQILTLDEVSQLSDAHLEELSRRCPKLRRFSLGDVLQSSLSEAGMVRFIDASNALECLNCLNGRMNNWTRGEFEACARHLGLELLSIPEVDDDWLDSLRHGKLQGGHPAFPRLRYFTTAISDEGLARLAPYMPDLESLSLSLERSPPSHHVLESASLFTKLTSLTVDFGQGSTLDGRDLVLLAQQCTELRELYLSEWDGWPPSGRGISDAVIDEAAHHMSRLSVLILSLDRSDLLTWRSMLSLARHCRNLMQLRLPCNVTWKEAMDEAPADTFPRLWHLTLVLDENNRGGPFSEEGREEETAAAYAAQLAAFAPKLSTFYLRGENSVDRALAKAVNDICNPKYVPRPLGDFTD